MARLLAIATSVVALVAAPASGQWVRGDLYVSSYADNCIYRVDSSLNVTTFADSSDGLNGPSALVFTPWDTLLVSNFATATVLEFDSAGNGSVLYDGSSGLVNPYGENGLAFDVDQNLYVSDFTLKEIFEFPAGGGAPSDFADSADGIHGALGLAFAPNGELFVANGNVLRITPAGFAYVFDSIWGETVGSIVVRGNSDVYVATSSAGHVFRYPQGDASRRYLLASVLPSRAVEPLQLSLDERTLYHSSSFNGNLFEIDTESGSANLVLPPGSLPGATSIAVYGPRIPANWLNYGSGFPGTNGVPSFTSEALPKIGTTIQIDLDNSLGLATVGLLFAGFSRIDLHSSFGGDLLVDPAFTFPIFIASGGDSFRWDIPDDLSLIGVIVDLQTIEADSGAAKGVSFTAGLEFTLGY